MTPTELLDNEIFALPKKFEKETTFLNFLNDFYTKYNTIINKIDTGIICEKIKEKKQEIQEHCDKLIQSLTTYFAGHIQDSFSLFQEAMQIIEPFLFPKKKGGKVRVIGLEDPFYRARVGSNNICRREQMFHRNFNEREYSNTDRFSIPGLPCLYLSNSIYVCWEELNRPQINTLYVSRFQKENHDLEILDISLTPINIKHLLGVLPDDGSFSNYKDEFCFSFIVKWPLIVSCSVLVLKEDAPFKPEYIFPQFLLQWVTQQKNIDGIKYFSVKSNPYNSSDYSNFINYVFPPKSTSQSGYSEHLKKSFRLTEPVSWEQLTLSDPSLYYLHKEEPLYKVMPENLQLEIIKGYKTAYVHTVFGRIEQLLYKTEIDWIKN